MTPPFLPPTLHKAVRGPALRIPAPQPRRFGHVHARPRWLSAFSPPRAAGERSRLARRHQQQVVAKSAGATHRVAQRPCSGPRTRARSLRRRSPPSTQTKYAPRSASTPSIVSTSLRRLAALLPRAHNTPTPRPGRPPSAATHSPLSSASTQEPAGSFARSASAFLRALPTNVPASSATAGIPPAPCAATISTGSPAAAASVENSAALCALPEAKCSFIDKHLPRI